MQKSSSDETYMLLAIDLAKQGEGHVEPNPMVGCVIVRGGEILGQGFHEQFGQAHAEVNAINSARTNGFDDLTGATAYVTLEPCCHTGKTGPCVDALIQASMTRVVVSVTDPNPDVAGGGIAKLKAAGIQVDQGVLEPEARSVLAPYLKLRSKSMPWIIAKWAMTLDGKIATSSGDSKWISNEASRKIVHQIRGRVDGVLVGAGTALADNPQLNARPRGARVATRIVVDSNARIGLDSKLVKTAKKTPVLIAVGPNVEQQKVDKLEAAGVEIFQSFHLGKNHRLEKLLLHLGQKGMTNVLVEGGGQILGAMHDLGQIDEAHIFVAPKILGGASSLSPIGGDGQPLVESATEFQSVEIERLENDLYIHARDRISR